MVISLAASPPPPHRSPIGKRLRAVNSVVSYETSSAGFALRLPGLSHTVSTKCHTEHYAVKLSCPRRLYQITPPPHPGQISQVPVVIRGISLSLRGFGTGRSSVTCHHCSTNPFLPSDYQKRYGEEYRRHPALVKSVLPRPTWAMTQYLVRVSIVLGGGISDYRKYDAEEDEHGRRSLICL